MTPTVQMRRMTEQEYDADRALAVPLSAEPLQEQP
jgi:hypothetical protein